MLLGLIWAFWHLPLFFIPGVDKSGQSFPVYALQVTALSVAMAWLYGHSNGSLLLAMLMHSAANQSRDDRPVGRCGRHESLDSGLVVRGVAYHRLVVDWCWLFSRSDAKGGAAARLKDSRR